MKIGLISPLYESVPPVLYGGTERVVYNLAEELVAMGQDVTLFASGDSHTNAKLIPIVEKSLRLDENSIDQVAPHVLMVERVFQMATDFDLIHFHIDHLQLPLARRHSGAMLSTFHGRLDIPDLVPLYSEFRDLPFTSISDSQRKPLSWLNWQGTVYHGLNPDAFSFRKKPGEYLAFLGRICEDKGIEHAIVIAKKFGMKLKVAAKVSDADQKFYEEKIVPLLDDPLVEFIGEINEEQKDAFLGNSYATLFPIVWPEPFGIVMIESMACGTPVIAFPHGSVPEVMVDGQSGYIVDDVDSAVEALKRVRSFDRQLCRNVFEEKYTSRRMAADYLKIYERLVNNAKQTAA